MKIQLAADQALRTIVTRPVVVITTLHESGLVNGGAFGAYTNVGPTEIGVAIGVASHTYQNLQRTGEFVINVATVEVVDSRAGSDLLISDGVVRGRGCRKSLEFPVFR